MRILSVKPANQPILCKYFVEWVIWGTKRDSDDEPERVIPLEDGISDASETEDVLEEPEGNISFSEYENEMWLYLCQKW